jgi:thermostable 8-oxoguanine DNA glycosylase
VRERRPKLCAPLGRPDVELAGDRDDVGVDAEARGGDVSGSSSGRIGSDAGTSVVDTNSRTVSEADVQPVALDWAALWDEFGGVYVERVAMLEDAGRSNVEHELLFCLLGGHGVTFELARSAANVLDELNVFDGEWSSHRLEVAIRSELETAQFKPYRHDDSLRRYRYPRRKARVVAQAAEWLNRHRPLFASLLALDDDVARRNLMCECPGVGLKTASWLLRNVGLGQALAVIDVHVLRALVAAGRINGARLPRDYCAVEQRFLAWCDDLNAPPAAFDLMLWEWQRAA